MSILFCCQENFSPEMIQEAQLTRGDDSYFLVEDDDDDVEPETHEEEVGTLEKKQT